MIGTILGALGAAGLDFGINQASSAINSKRQYKYQSMLMKQQQAWNEKVMKNHHSWEVSSLRDAGLNPLLSATGGSGSTVSTGAPGFSSSGSSESDILNNIRDVQALEKGGKEIDLLEKQKEKLDSDIRLQDSQIDKNASDAALQDSLTKKNNLENQFYEEHPNSRVDFKSRLLNNFETGASSFIEFTPDLWNSISEGGKNAFRGYGKKVGLVKDDGSVDWVQKDNTGKFIQYNGWKR